MRRMLFMSGRDKKRGATKAIHATFSKNAPKKKGKIKKGSHGTQLLKGGEVGALSTLLQLHSATSRFAFFELKCIWLGHGCFPFAIVANTCTCRRWELQV